MRVRVISRFLGVMVLALPLAAWAAPGDGLQGSIHDFTDPANTAANVDDTAATNKTTPCIFCHVPHRFRGATDGTRLLWNHQASGETYSWEITETWGGTSLPTNIDTWGGTTKNCLSCHDGTISIGAVLRGGDAAWVYSGSHINASGVISGVGHFFGPSGDLEGNHPVAIPYPYNAVSSTYNGITSGTTADFVANPANVRLYTDIGSNEVVLGATAGSTGMECATCHDPHNKDVVEDNLLRDTYFTAPKGQLCLDCHDK
jgi:predicted CXXCH cytochrome family protein